MAEDTNTMYAHLHSIAFTWGRAFWCQDHCGDQHHGWRQDGGLGGFRPPSTDGFGRSQRHRWPAQEWLHHCPSRGSGSYWEVKNTSFSQFSLNYRGSMCLEQCVIKLLRELKSLWQWSTGVKLDYQSGFREPLLGTLVVSMERQVIFLKNIFCYNSMN